MLLAPNFAIKEYVILVYNDANIKFLGPNLVDITPKAS